MVRMNLTAIIILGIASPILAQEVDWRSAGGGLFATATPEPVFADALDREDVVTLAGLNQPFQDAVDAAARAHGLDPKLLHAVVITESAYQTAARSSAGAVGLTQLMPGTALELGVRDRLDPIENLNGGADYLARQIRRFGDLRLALAAYHAGPERVARLGAIPASATTQAYVATVVECFLALAAGRRVISARQCRSRGAGR